MPSKTAALLGLVVPLEGDVAEWAVILVGGRCVVMLLHLGALLCILHPPSVGIRHPLGRPPASLAAHPGGVGSPRPSARRGGLDLIFIFLHKSVYRVHGR